MKGIHITPVAESVGTSEENAEQAAEYCDPLMDAKDSEPRARNQILDLLEQNPLT